MISGRRPEMCSEKDRMSFIWRGGALLIQNAHCQIRHHVNFFYEFCWTDHHDSSKQLLTCTILACSLHNKHKQTRVFTVFFTYCIELNTLCKSISTKPTNNGADNGTYVAGNHIQVQIKHFLRTCLHVKLYYYDTTKLTEKFFPLKMITNIQKHCFDLLQATTELIYYKYLYYKCRSASSAPSVQ